jgi:hypothetical protein
VQEYKSKPFVLLGVNSDSREKLKELIDRNEVTWTSFWDGGNIYGPIAKSWNVRGWPSQVVIDRKGVIRFKGRGVNIDPLVARLLAEKP